MTVKVVMAYFSDCKVVSDKIANKEYKYQDMPMVIQEYNKWYNDPKVKKKRDKKKR